MKILITGCDGYIGSVLGPCLQERGHRVTGLDTGFYRDACLYDGTGQVPTLLRDTRRVTEEEVEGFDAIVHLAELSNDPLGQYNRELTFAINHRGTVALAKLCKKVGVPRFIYTSSCSVYGAGAGEFKSEESDTNPQTAYAECKVLVERDVSAIANDDFSPTFLRNATAYGASPRMRFDLVLNNLAGSAWTRHEIKMTSDGTPWRPLVHVLDICHAIACCLEAPRQAVHNQVFNVGDSRENYQIKEIASLVAETFLGCSVRLGNSDGDNRSYRVSFEKIAAKLPGFRCRWNATKGAEQLLDVFERVGLTAAGFESRAFTRLKQLEYLIQSHQIDNQLFWRQA